MANILPYIRRKMKLKQNDLARALKVSPSYLCKIENGTMEPNEKFITNCSEYLNIPRGVLFPDKVKKEKISTMEINQKNKIWTVRQQKGIKQYELAKLLKCSPSYLSKIEKGLQRPSKSFKNRCAKLLKVKVQELFD